MASTASSSVARSTARALLAPSPRVFACRSAASQALHRHSQSYATSTSSTASQPAPTSSSHSSTSSLGNTISQVNAAPSSSSQATKEATGKAEASPLQQSLLTGIAKVMGYNNTTATAIRTTSDYYDKCSERDEKEATFFYDECGLPKSYQSWMQIANLHIWLLSVRFRSLPAPHGKTYIQEMINHYFIHAEMLMRSRYNVKQGRLIKGYLRDMLYQYHGSNMGYDEGLLGPDHVLAAAVWRNLFGAGWGKMGGVKGKLTQEGKTTNEQIAKKAVEGTTGNSEDVLSNVNLDPSLPPSPSPLLDNASPLPNQSGGYHAGGSGTVDPLPANVPGEIDFASIESKDARFALNLERLVKFIRSEVHRMQKIPDEEVMNALNYRRDSTKNTDRLTAFQRI